MYVTVHELMTARKRSLGQGNIFTPVCHSVHRGCLVLGVPGPRGLPGERGCVWRPPGMATAVGGTHPTGMHSCCSE